METADFITVASSMREVNSIAKERIPDFDSVTLGQE
jgi:hypothetical protein